MFFRCIKIKIYIKFFFIFIGISKKVVVIDELLYKNFKIGINLDI